MNLTKNQREFAAKTLEEYQGGRGVSTRSGPLVRSELSKAYGEWRRDKTDPISIADAKLIKKRLTRYSRRSRQDPHHIRGSRAYWRPHDVEDDAGPADTSGRRSGFFRGDRDDRPSVRRADNGKEARLVPHKKPSKKVDRFQVGGPRRVGLRSENFGADPHSYLPIRDENPPGDNRETPDYRAGTFGSDDSDAQSDLRSDRSDYRD